MRGLCEFFEFVGQLFLLTWRLAAPPSANITLDTRVNFDILANKKKISELTSTVDGPFCYQYV